MPGTLIWAPLSLPQTPPLSKPMLGLDQPLWLLEVQNALQQQPSGETWKLHSALGAHSKVKEGREGVSRGLGLCFYWEQGRGPRVWGTHSLSVNLKHKSRNLDWEEKETSGPKDQLGKSTKNSKTKESVPEESWLCTMWLAVVYCRQLSLRGCLCEMNTSQNQSLSCQTFALTEIKTKQKTFKANPTSMCIRTVF